MGAGIECMILQRNVSMKGGLEDGSFDRKEVNVRKCNVHWIFILVSGMFLSESQSHECRAVSKIVRKDRNIVRLVLMVRVQSKYKY